MIEQLPVFRGYTVDVKLKEFRRVKHRDNPEIEFIRFESEKGKKLLDELLAEELRKIEFDD